MDGGAVSASAGQQKYLIWIVYIRGIMGYTSHLWSSNMRAIVPFFLMLTLGPACSSSTDKEAGPEESSSDDTAASEQDTGDEDIDSDGDGYLASEDCNDADASIYPDAEEVCDGVDNDCDDVVDEDLLTSYYADLDGDGFGDIDSQVDACEAPEGMIALGGDCDDTDADINPSGVEYCDDIDNNCDGEVDGDDAIDPSDWYQDIDGDGYGDIDVFISACDAPEGYVANNTDCDDVRGTVNPGMMELCDDMDNNCDDLVDDASSIDASEWYRDADGDGFGNPDSTMTACDAPVGYVLDASDCDDSDLRIYPEATEVCNGADDNCDGTVDEGFPLETYYRDADGDGHGSVVDIILSCTPIAGYVTVGDDCDDAEYWSYPGLAELCDDIDNDCDGVIDEELTWVDFVPDADGDGYGSAAGPVVTECSPPDGYVIDTTDCDDEDPEVNPASIESCNGVDDNCNGELDEGLPTYVYYEDLDADGFGVPDGTVDACDTPEGYAEVDTDCDDLDDETYPGAYEFCDGEDDDCDGVIDDDCGFSRNFVLFVTDASISSSESSWIEDRDAANAYCESYGEGAGIDGTDYRIVYSTPDENAKDYLVYEGGVGHNVFDSSGTLVDEEDLWDGTDIRLPDMRSWTITGTWNDGEFHECSGSYPAGSWPICQYCDQKFACGSSSDNPFEPGACCWTGNRAIVCMATID
ncbi:MAG: hypothetical protein CL930_08380 [Deltaproteobacteria bacterium]|nr:hypothetical protein [Deltaproteobacteria bacterium]